MNIDAMVVVEISGVTSLHKLPSQHDAVHSEKAICKPSPKVAGGIASHISIEHENAGMHAPYVTATAKSDQS